jgi:hypothetical protein
LGHSRKTISVTGRSGVNATVCTPVSRLRSPASENSSDTTGRPGSGARYAAGQAAAAVGVAAVVGDPVGTGDPVADGVGVLVEVGDTELVGARVAVAVGLGVGVPVAVADVGTARSSRSVHAGAVTRIAAISHAAGRRMLTP